MKGDSKAGEEEGLILYLLAVPVSIASATAFSETAVGFSLQFFSKNNLWFFQRSETLFHGTPLLST